MSEEITIKLDEALRVYRFISDVRAFMHQPMNFDKTEEFAMKNIDELKKIYYKIMWDWFPKDVQEKLMEE